MKVTEAPWPAVRPEVAFAIADGVYRLADFRLVIHDKATGRAIIIETEPSERKRENVRTPN